MRRLRRLAALAVLAALALSACRPSPPRAGVGAAGDVDAAGARHLVPSGDGRHLVPSRDGRHLVLISIDALRPEFYLDPAFPAPTLRELSTRGSHARAAEPVFPTVTYPNHAAIVTGVRPARHGVPFNQVFEPTGERGRWYEEAADLRAPPLWEWARSAGLETAAVSWPSTLGARIDFLVPERNYHVRPSPLDDLVAATTPGLFDLTGVAPRAEMFKDVTQSDAFLAATAAALIRRVRPHLVLLHLAQMDVLQHRHGRDALEVKTGLARIDGHLKAIVEALREASVFERATLIVVGDHGFQDVQRLVRPNELLARAGLRACPHAGEGWRATVHVAGGSAAVFVSSPGDAEAAARAEAALAAEAGGRYALVSRRELDDLGAMPGAAFALEASPGWAIDGSCGRGLVGSGSGGTHGFLPSRGSMATGFIAAGAGVRAGVVLDRVRLVDVAPTAARLLGIAAPPVEGRVLTEILE